MKPTAKSYFSGAGGMDLGLERSGINVIQSLEIDEKCCQTLRENFDHNVLHVDISDVEVLKQKKSDIQVFTYPCNKYSAIGDIHGVRTGDELYLHAFRHMALEQSEAYILENVPGMKKFPIVMEAMTRLPGYHVQVLELNADIWLPQRRKRLIIIGTKREFKVSVPGISSSKPKLKELIESDADVTMTKGCYDRLAGKYRDMPIITNPKQDDAHAPTCVAHYRKDRSTRMVVDETFSEGVRPYTPREYARLQGFPDSFVFPHAGNEIYKQVGNAVAVDMAEYIGSELINYFNN